MQQQYNKDHPREKAYSKKKNNKAYPNKKTTEIKGVNEVKTTSKEEDVWKSLRGRSFGKISMICKVIRRSNEKIAFTKELTNSTMDAFMNVFADKKGEWNSSNTEGYVVDFVEKLPTVSEENDPEDISTESALSVVIGVDPKELIPKLDEIKIYQLQKD